MRQKVRPVVSVALSQFGDFTVDKEAIPEALVEVPTEAEGDHQGSRV